MTTASYVIRCEMENRARQSRGVSNAAIYQMVSSVLGSLHTGGGVLVDVGCGAGQLASFVKSQFEGYVGIDAIRYRDFPHDAEFHFADLNAAQLPLADNSADVVAAVETIEHLENPRAFMRELVRLAKPGASVVITTPNQLSLLSLLTLVTKQQFNAFQDVHYPAHVTALLETDLRRIASECGLDEIEIAFSHEGRLPFTARHYPKFLSALFPRQMSDNVLLIGKKGQAGSLSK
jgi:2-polyprenyl-3-methyl-5-hydroxy-6-metoxy-1,4-benzoquinol methylase